MAFTRLPYEPPPLSKIRQRLVKNLLAEGTRRETALRGALQERGPEAVASINDPMVELLQQTASANATLRDEFTIIEHQNEAERETELALKSPLRQAAKQRLGFFRSSNERNLAILGNLEFERRQSAPLKRDAYQRAQAIAASRKYHNVQSGLRGSRGYSYSVKPWEIEGRAAAITQALVSMGKSVYIDPCDDRRIRREVLFATRRAGKAGRFYRRGFGNKYTPLSDIPC